MNDKNLSLELRRVRKSVRTSVDTGRLAPPKNCGPTQICRPTSCSGTGYADAGVGAELAQAF